MYCKKNNKGRHIWNKIWRENSTNFPKVSQIFHMNITYILTGVPLQLYFGFKISTVNIWHATVSISHLSCLRFLQWPIEPIF